MKVVMAVLVAQEQMGGHTDVMGHPLRRIGIAESKMCLRYTGCITARSIAEKLVTQYWDFVPARIGGISQLVKVVKRIMLIRGFRLDGVCLIPEQKLRKPPGVVLQLYWAVLAAPTLPPTTPATPAM